MALGVRQVNPHLCHCHTHGSKEPMITNPKNIPTLDCQIPGPKQTGLDTAGLLAFIQLDTEQ